MASSSIAHRTRAGVTVGVDTHGEVHVAAAFTGDLGGPWCRRSRDEATHGQVMRPLAGHLMRPLAVT